MANYNPSPATRFRPGNTAAAGRKGKNLTARIGELLDGDAKNGKKFADALARVIVQKALSGDFRFVELVINRIDGKVPDKISIYSDGTSDAIRDYLSGKASTPETDG